MSDTYDKIQVRWITSAQKIAEYRRRGLTVDPQQPFFTITTDRCIAETTLHAWHELSDTVTQDRDRARADVEHKVKCLLLRERYKPIHERRDRIMRMKDDIMVRIDRTIHFTDMEKLFTPLDEIMSIVYPSAIAKTS